MPAPRKATPAAATKPKISAAHRKDIQTIAVKLKEAAIEHDLCDEFYDVIDDLNDDLLCPLSVDRSKDGEISITLSGIHGRFETQRAGWNRLDLTAAQEKLIADAVQKAILALPFIDSTDNVVEISVDD